MRSMKRVGDFKVGDRFILERLYVHDGVQKQVLEVVFVYLPYNGRTEVICDDGLKRAFITERQFEMYEGDEDG